MKISEEGLCVPLEARELPSDPGEAVEVTTQRVRAIPEDWKATLARVQRVFPEAALAGGALRDHVLGRPVKDLDIFIWAERFALADIAETIEGAIQAGAIGQGLLAVPLLRPVEGSENDGLRFMHWTVSLDGMPVQVVGYVPPCKDRPDMLSWIVNRSDFGLCRLATDGRRVLVHPHFIHDAQGQLFTLRRRNMPLEGEIKRWRGLAIKYPGWGFEDATQGALGGSYGEC